MQVLSLTIGLFLLNFFDAVLTLYWVRNGFATEGNLLMATLLEMGDAPFLIVKFLIGAMAAIVLWRWSNLRVAKYGLTIALVVYLGIMAVHVMTGLSAFGLLSDTFVSHCAEWSESFFALAV